MSDQPADIRLTRQQKQVLRYVQAHPGVTAPQVAHAIGARPVYTYAALEALVRFRWLRSEHSIGTSVYDDTFSPR